LAEVVLRCEAKPAPLGPPPRPRQPRRRGPPGCGAAPHASGIGLAPGRFGGNSLRANHGPFRTGGDPNGPASAIRNLERPEQASRDGWHASGSMPRRPV
jgi:hypothetical protein